MSILGFIIISLVFLIILYLAIFFKFGYVDCESSVCLVGKTALVTGGSSGIGYQIVLSLASRGCKVIIADRIVDATIKEAIIGETDNSNIVLEYVDFASFKSIRNFVQKLKTYEEKLDILVNNVGIGKGPETPSGDGLNQTLQINYYGPFLLTHLLIDLLKNSNGGRIIFTASVASFFHNMTRDFVTSDTIQLPLFRMRDYANAKLMTVVTSDMFAEKLKRFNITCNCYHPGIVQSTFFKNTQVHLNYYSFWDLSIYFSLFLVSILFGVSPKKAAQAGINLATSKKFKNTTGIFFGKYFPNLKPLHSSDKVFCNKIWAASEQIVKLKPEELL
ncbi:unnamed protein product [Psylliodes chrysocephalus]|uniref:Uncharacterized protein n=1 Tax=Psylliodes chrysocephalus TaxID=3402493 RepID=A0A9P0GIV8_9CUCU|nr:unnamed protein product [Psylliodes chrysocephala]